MSQRPVFCFFTVLLVIAVSFSGCTSQQAAPQTPAPAPAIAATTAAQAPSPEITTAAKTVQPTRTTVPAGKILLTEKGMISQKEYKTFYFKSMGHQFLQPGEKYRITLRADKPVIGYAVFSEQASQLTGDTLTPHYVAHSDKIQWGLIEPYMVRGKVTDSEKTFTVEELGPYVYVVDARWMTFDDDYKSVGPFNYELTITEIL